LFRIFFVLNFFKLKVALVMEDNLSGYAREKDSSGILFFALSNGKKKI